MPNLTNIPIAIFFIAKSAFGNKNFVLVKKIQLLVKKKPMDGGGDVRGHG